MTTLPLRSIRVKVRLRPGIPLALALVLILVLISLNSLLLQLPTAVTPALVRPPYRTLADLPLPLQFAISRDLGRDDLSYYLTADRASAHARNPAQGLAATFDNDGLHISTGDQTWALALVGWGRGDTLTAIPPAAPPVVRANRLEVAHGSMAAWYVNGPLSIQQG